MGGFNEKPVRNQMMRLISRWKFMIREKISKAVTTSCFSEDAEEKAGRIFVDKNIQKKDACVDICL